MYTRPHLRGIVDLRLKMLLLRVIYLCMLFTVKKECNFSKTYEKRTFSCNFYSTMNNIQTLTLKYPVNLSREAIDTRRMYTRIHRKCYSCGKKKKYKNTALNSSN